MEYLYIVLQKESVTIKNIRNIFLGVINCQ